jgi:hypothetical protein
LKKHRAEVNRVLIIVEGLYSMDGDLANLPSLLEIRNRYGAWLMVDEAHSLGVLGSRGRGLAEHFGIDPKQIDMIVGTMSKTLGACGGFVAGGKSMIDWLRSANWGFVPFSSAEIEALLAELRPFFRGEYGRFVLFNNEPVGVVVALPNINEAIARFHGRLLPFNWTKLLWALSRQRIRSARVPLLGLKQAYQSTPVGGMLLALLLSEFFLQMQAYRLDWVEFSWILETNRRMIALAEMAAGPPVKTYRIYGKELL